MTDNQPEITSVSEHLSKLPESQKFFFNLRRINLIKPYTPLDNLMRFFDDVYVTINFPRQQSFNEINAIPLLIDSLSLINQKSYIIFRPFDSGGYEISDAENTIICTVIKPNGKNFFHNIRIKYNKEDNKFHLEFNQTAYAFDSLNEVKTLIEKNDDIELEYFTKQEIERINNDLTRSLTNLIRAARNEYPLSHLRRLMCKSNSLFLWPFMPRIIRITYSAVECLELEQVNTPQYSQFFTPTRQSSFQKSNNTTTETTPLMNNDNECFTCCTIL